MGDRLVVKLMIEGIMAAIGHDYDETADAREAVKSKATSMEGILKTLITERDFVSLEELSHLNDRLDEVFTEVHRLDYASAREQVTNTIELIPDDSVRERVLRVSMVLYSLIHNTRIQEVSIQVNKTIAPASSSEEGYDEALTDTIIETVNTTTSATQIAERVMELNREGISIFSQVHHENEDPLHIVVDAASHENAVRNELIISTGALYLLCQTLCASTQDIRGVYATAIGDGVFARSENGPSSNACHISLRYSWPTPLQFRRVQQLTNHSIREREDESSCESKYGPIINAMEQKQSEFSIKNVYLLGETGEGKSTLGNVLTGTEAFYISHAGTGTFGISGTFATDHGLLGGGHEILVWDTAGMNDQQGRDKISEAMLHQHLTRENTVSTIIVVSKDGSRIPRTLSNTLEVYRRAFGDAFTTTICVCIGLNEQRTHPERIAAVFNFWTTSLCSILSIPPGSMDGKIFFYNAIDSSPQPSAERLKHLILNSPVRLTGTGVAILQGLQKLRHAQLRDEEKRAMFRASEEQFKAIRNELQRAPHVKFKVLQFHQAQVSSMSVSLLPSLRTALKGYFRNLVLGKLNTREERKIILNSKGERALKLLSRHFLVNHEIYHGSKINFIIRNARRNELILVPGRSGGPRRELRTGELQQRTYNLLHLEDELDMTVFDEVDEILRLMTIDPHFAATFGNFISRDD